MIVIMIVIIIIIIIVIVVEIITMGAGNKGGRTYLFN